MKFSNKQNRALNFYEDGTPLSGADATKLIREQSDTIMLAFSCGKDSVAAWLAIRDIFPHIIPYYMYLVPDLEFVEESLEYYENYFDTRIMRVPNPNLYRMLNKLTFQPPERCAVIEAARIWEFSPEDLREAMVDQLDIDPETFTAVGVRAADSPQRRMACNSWGPINWDTKSFWPVHDMYKDELIELVKAHDIRLASDYDLFGRSFDGIDFRFTLPLKEKRPRDYAKILEWFPLAELDIMRYSLKGGTYEEE
jgi:hypothetical protein